MKKYKGWFVYSVVPSFLGGHITLYKTATLLEQLKGTPKYNTYLDTPSIKVSEFWGANQPRYWTSGLYQAARDYIDSGAKEAIEEGFHTIKFDTSREEK